MTWAEKKAISITEQETDGCCYVTYHKDFFPEFLTQLITEVAAKARSEVFKEKKDRLSEVHTAGRKQGIEEMRDAVRELTDSHVFVDKIAQRLLEADR